MRHRASKRDGKRSFGRPSPAMVLAVIALIAALGGSAVAAHRHKVRLPKNSVGTRQLKRKAVTTGKLANNAVNGAKVANGSLTGADINIGALGTVPAATQAAHAGAADTVGGHAAACPAATTLVRGICFDLALNPPVNGAKEAANGCAAKGGWLPSVMDLYAVRNVINLGTGDPPNYAVANEVYANTSGVNYSAVAVDGTGKIIEIPSEGAGSSAQYICAYPLVR